MWLFAFFIFFSSLAYMCPFTLFPQAFIFAFVLFPLLLQSSGTPFPLRDLNTLSVLFFISCSVVWCSPVAYNYSPCLKKCRLAKVGELQIYRAKFSLRILCPQQCLGVFICWDSFKIRVISGAVTSFWKRALLKWNHSFIFLDLQFFKYQ